MVPLARISASQDRHQLFKTGRRFGIRARGACARFDTRITITTLRASGSATRLSARRCNDLCSLLTSVCGCQDQKRMTRASLLERVTWSSIAPVSRQFTGRQPLYFEDETFAARATIPPPKRSDSRPGSPSRRISRPRRRKSGSLRVRTSWRERWTRLR
jgi:hypothetical protein